MEDDAGDRSREPLAAYERAVELFPGYLSYASIDSEIFEELRESGR